MNHSATPLKSGSGLVPAENKPRPPALSRFRPPMRVKYDGAVQSRGARRRPNRPRSSKMLKEAIPVTCLVTTEINL